jgi:hypothetical protein
MFARSHTHTHTHTQVTWHHGDKRALRRQGEREFWKEGERKETASVAREEREREREREKPKPYALRLNSKL